MKGLYFSAFKFLLTVEFLCSVEFSIKKFNNLGARPLATLGICGCILKMMIRVSDKHY